MNKEKKHYNIQGLFNELLIKYDVIDTKTEQYLDIIVEESANSKAALTVILTGLVYKHYHPKQDVRKHQKGISGGYSGRNFDRNFITPFLKKNHFPAMAESGWLTRSFEQALPYDVNYSGSIRGKGVKEAFLQIYNRIEEGKDSPDKILSILFRKLVKKRDGNKLLLSSPTNLTIDVTLKLIQDHIEHIYKVSGSSRLPVLAIYAAYKAILTVGNKRYNDKELCTLESHTTADKSTGSIGDIQINNNDHLPFEGIEIKARAITTEMIDTVYQKIQSHKTVSRYYLLSTKKIDKEQKQLINNKIIQIRSKHGCDVIVNGVYDTLKYFLRLNDTETFINNYKDYLISDNSIKYDHRKKWNELCGQL